MCRPTVQDQADALALQRLQQQLQQQFNPNGGTLDHLAQAGRGRGPRIFCGHVPPECSEELVKAHFSQWGHVVDVYFPKRKDTFRRRPFCFVTFATLEDAQRALSESPMNICGIPIKQLNLVEDRADYYKQRHTATQSALVQALQTLAILGEGGAGAAGGPLPAVDLANLAALLSLEGGAAGAQAPAMPQAYPGAPVPGFGAAPRYAPAPAPAPLPFANLPGFSGAGAGLALPAAAPAYLPPAPQPGYTPAPLLPECRLSGGSDWLPTGAASPYSPLETLQQASAASSPPKGGPAVAALPTRGSASPDNLQAATVNQLAMWRLQSELLASGAEWGASGLAAN